ncbi:MAG: EAL domain-containing protein [Idiomarina sp.]|nr:EAL domain-containing protein [Idiomarina sp.]
MRLSSIRTQLLLYLALVGGIALAAGVLAIVNEQVRQNHLHGEREVTAMANIAQGSMNRALRYELSTAVDEILLEINTNRRVRNVFNVSENGTILRVSNAHQWNLIDRPIFAEVPALKVELLQQALASNIIIFDTQHSGDSYAVYVPVTATSKELGRAEQQLLFFEYEHRINWQAAVFERRQTIFIAIGFFSILFLLLMLFLQRRITYPVEQLSAAIAKLEHGELIDKIPVEGKSELAQLARGTEKMVRERFRNENRINLLSTALEQSNEGVIITSLEPKIEYVNRALLENTGYTEEELLGKNPSVLGSGKTSKATYAKMWQTLLAGKPWTGELKNKRKDGSEYSELQTISPVRNEQGEISHYLGIKQDISAQKQIQERLHFLAYYNHLSRLPNRLSLMEHISGLLQKASANRDYWLILLNIDRMKRINDARGYDYGNTVINAMAKRLQNFLTHDVFLAHTGADNFACLVKFSKTGKNTVEKANDFAWELKQMVEEPLDIYGERVQLTMSLGLANLAASASAEDLFRQAETALHRVKEKGGSEVAIYNQGDGEQAESLFGLERDLYYAVENDQIEMYLQGQFNPDGELIGAEALARWQHPTEGMVPPDQFVAVAERSDLIIKLDRLMLKQAAMCLAKWQEKGLHWTLSVNISPRFFRSNQLRTELLDIFNAANADVQGLVLEVTERLFIDDMHEVISQMVTISEVGVQFALDDFGTGYSSLAYLQRLPIQELKIDQSFTQGLPKNKRDVAMVKMITAIARNLDLRIVAEGIETREQNEYCQREHVNMQGYYFDRPAPEYEWQRKWCK